LQAHADAVCRVPRHAVHGGRTRGHAGPAGVPGHGSSDFARHRPGDFPVGYGPHQPQWNHDGGNHRDVHTGTIRGLLVRDGRAVWNGTAAQRHRWLDPAVRAPLRCRIGPSGRWAPAHIPGGSYPTQDPVPQEPEHPVTLTTSHRPALAEEVTDKLRAMIHSGEWPLQQRIPAEPELMASLGVSRGTLREAIKALAHSGMREVRRGDGTYVRAVSEISGAAQRMYKEHTQEHILEVRVALDTQAARLAARHATPEDVAVFRSLLALREDSWHSGDYATWAKADWEFHERVALATGNPLLHELYAR